MGIFARIGHDYPGGRRDNRFCEHAPAGVVDELDTVGFKRADISSGLCLLVFAAPAGNDHRHDAMLVAGCEQLRNLAELFAGGMRIADGDQVNTSRLRIIELVPAVAQIGYADLLMR